MLSLSRISKQYGRQVLFVDASFQLNPGEKVGLVGPNGAGKTTIFRMITGEESPDEGDVSVPKKMSIGYFRQDVDEMSGRSVLDEAIAGSGRLGDLHHELEALQHAMSDPAQAGDMDRILERFGEVQEEYEHSGGYGLEAHAREVLHGLGFAGALSEIGLPEGNVPLALLFFNLGVEAGQLAMPSAHAASIRFCAARPESNGPRKIANGAPTTPASGTSTNTAATWQVGMCGVKLPQAASRSF